MCKFGHYLRIWRINMKRLTQGSIIEIHVHHEYYVYAQFLKNSFIAIFDGKYSKPVCSTKELNTQNVLFIICVSISDMIKLIFFSYTIVKQGTQFQQNVLNVKVWSDVQYGMVITLKTEFILTIITQNVNG